MNRKPPVVEPPQPAVEPADQRRIIYYTEEQLRARLDHDLALLDSLKDMTDETDTDELWDEVLRNLGVDPDTGRSLDP